MNEEKFKEIILGKKEFLYADEYMHLPQTIGNFNYIDATKFCTSICGIKDIKEWLKNHNAYRDIESVMCTGPNQINNQMRGKELVSTIFDNYPIIGDPILSDNQLRDLLSEAQEVFDKILDPKADDLTDYQKDVLTLAMIQYLKKRNNQSEEADNLQFWSYIYSQFGFTGNSSKKNQLYNVLRSAAKDSLTRHHRYFVPDSEKANRYYDSLMIHALSPRQTIETFFDILLHFYGNDLDYHYIPHSPIFESLVNCINKKFDDFDLNPKSQENIEIQSFTSSISLKLLFKNCKSFMREFCERIVKSTNDLILGKTEMTSDPTSTVDQMLLNWYRNKSLQERENIRTRSSMRGGHSYTSTPVTRYILEKNAVYIAIPQIPLVEIYDDFPQLTLYQDNIKIHTQQLNCFGKYSRTINSTKVALKDTEFDSEKPFNFRAKIEYNNKTVFDSQTKLFRSLLTFNEIGNEISVQSHYTGACYVFLTDEATINPINANLFPIDHLGQLYKTILDEESILEVDGVQLFVSEENGRNEIHCYPSVSKQSGIRGAFSGYSFPVFDQPFSLRVNLPDGKNSYAYRVDIDSNVKAKIENYRVAGKNRFSIPCPSEPQKIHTLQIYEFDTNKTVYVFRYAILPNVRVKIGQSIIYNNGDPIDVSLSYDGCDIFDSIIPEESAASVKVSANHLDYELEVDLPIISGSLLNTNLFHLDSCIWKGRISDSTVVKLKYPNKWYCRLMLGDEKISQNRDGSFELGNAVLAHSTDADSERLQLLVKTPDGEQDWVQLSKIAFKPQFVAEPVSIRNDALYWEPESTFVGKEKADLRLTVEVFEDPFEYAVSTKNEVIDHNFCRDVPAGEYHYKVSIGANSIFAKSERKEICEGNLCVGKPEEWNMNDKCLYLSSARCWVTKEDDEDQFINLPLTAGTFCLERFQFNCFSRPEFDLDEAPEYIATLYFYDTCNNRWSPFNDREHPVYEQVNPVHVWILNKTKLIIKQSDGEALLVDRIQNRIVNRKGLSEKRVLLPDSFECYE